jgi:hypothetical protein
MYEKRHQQLLPIKAFIRRVLLNFTMGMLIILVSLGIGMWGYSHFENMEKVDAFVNAAMILSGMGPAAELKTDPGKIFAGIYALFSGIVFLIVIAAILAPLFHRSLHKFLIKDSNN